MSTASNVSTSALPPGTLSPQPVKPIDSVPLKGAKTLPEQTDDDALDARLRRKQSPTEFFYAAGGAFAEGTYTEF